VSSGQPPRGPFDADDTVPGDRRSPDLWRRAIRSDVDTLKVDLRNVKASIAEITTLTRRSATHAEEAKEAAKQAKMAAEDAAAKQDMHMAATADVIAAYGKVQKGIAVMDGIGRAGEWVVEKWKPILVVVVAVKIIVSGGTWSEAWGALAKMFKGPE
jgi:hypothetical protein